MNTDITHNTQTVQLPARITLETVEALVRDLKEITTTPGSSLVLDATNTEVITTPGMQLFLALEKTLRQTNANLSLQNVKASVVEVFRTFGLEKQFCEWSAAHE
jgi:anti-anti-sigma regulatory factor